MLEKAAWHLLQGCLRAAQAKVYSGGTDQVGGISERHKEIKRRRHRRKKLAQLHSRLKKATVSEKAVIAAKIRNLTPGAEVLIDAWELRESDR
jgi:hypothetical protein